MSLTSIQLPAAAVCWRLDGPAGIEIDTLVASLIGAGVAAEPIRPTTAYRLEGPRPLLQALAAELTDAESFTLAVEVPPSDSIGVSSRVGRTDEPKRSVTVHGAGVAHTHVARAVDRRLTVRAVGVCRWEITGPTLALMNWLATVWTKPLTEVLPLFGLTVDSAVAEDTPLTPAVSVAVQLPERLTKSEIERNADGEIVSVVQLTTTKEPAP